MNNITVAGWFVSKNIQARERFNPKARQRFIP
jgi:hypothetical protein